jgi:cell wall-associated NlpC family hydrolase
LREKTFALSRRKPDDPELAVDNTQNALAPDVGAGIEGEGAGVVGPEGIRWGDCFARSAKQWHGPWPMDLFLATLLAICEHETHFQNVRNGGTTEFYDEPIGGGSKPGPPAPDYNSKIETWRNLFANKAGNMRIPISTSQDSHARANGLAVGPMQLLTEGYKVWADEIGGTPGEYGSRWDPCSNIWAGGRALASKASGVDPGNPNNLFIGVGAYYGTGTSADADYGNLIKKRVDNYFLPIVNTSIEAAAKVPTTGGTFKTITVQNAPNHSPAQVKVQMPDSAPDDLSTLVRWLLNQLGKPYMWGGAGPDAFDCSGLLTFCYAKIGISLIHQASQQYGQGTSVKKSQLSIGDGVFFNNLEHVGVYLNDNNFIQAPHTGDVVKISSLSERWYSDNWVGARRFRPWKGDPT